MSLTKFSVTHPVTTIMVTVALVVFGLTATTRIPVTLLPTITYPTFVVETSYPGAAPVEVENLVTRPIEEAAGVLPGVHRIKSRSTTGLSQVTIAFGWGTNMDMATLDVREKLDLLTLPEEADKPLILKYDPLSDPVIRLAYAGRAPSAVLRTTADKVIKRNLETLEGVAAVKVIGGQDREIRVTLSPDRLRFMGVTLDQVGNALAQHNVNVAGGSLYQNDMRFTVRALNRMLTPEDVRKVPVGTVRGTPVTLRDVGEVRWAYQRPEALSAMLESPDVSGHPGRTGKRRPHAGERREKSNNSSDGTLTPKSAVQPAIELALYREGDTNVVALAKRVRAYLPRLEKSLPEGTRLKILFDGSTYIKDAIAEVKSNAVTGGLLAVIILFLFLGNLRTTIAVGLSIPVSIIATFFFMEQAHISFNLMSLGGLALGVGMLVDNAIVVSEAIQRKRDEKVPFPDAAISGSKEIAGAITASTLTTVAVFLPVLFLQGFAAQIFRDEALTVTFALLASLIVALSLITTLAVKLGGGKTKVKKRRSPLTGILGGYTHLLRRTLKRPLLTILLFLVLFILTLGAATRLPVDLLPSLHQGTLILNVKLPPGTRLEKTHAFAEEILTACRDLPQVTTAFATSGRWQRGSRPEEERGENTTELYLILKGRDLAAAERQVQDKLVAFLALKPRVIYTFSRPTILSFATPVEVEVYGDNLEQLQETGRMVIKKLKEEPYLVDVQSTATEQSPEIQVSFLPEKLAYYGFSYGVAADTLKKAVEGNVATKLTVGEEEIGVRVKTFRGEVFKAENLGNLAIGWTNGKKILLSQVASVRQGLGPAEIQRVGQRRVVTVTANLKGLYLSGAVSRIRTLLAGLTFPSGVEAVISGANKEMEESMKSLLLAFLLAVFCVYVVMASQFESFLHPFIILLTVPLGVMGAVGTLLLFHLQINVIVIIGMVMLAGIVVNNGIVMVDTANQIRRAGASPADAIVQAAGIRFRPILMTALTTILGLLPLSFGMGPGAELKAPLGITVVGGLTVATFLTLFFIPALYKVVTRR